MSKSNDLPGFKRYITAHDDKGKSVIHQFDENPPWDNGIQDGRAAFNLSYLTNAFPVDMNDDKDIKTYESYIGKPPGLVSNNGTVLRIVDMSPGIASAMHRTVSLDYGIVLIGEVDMELDSGETRIMKAGDVCIQRGTNHLWRNRSSTEWARLLFMLQPCVPVEVGGEKLGEALGTMKGVPASH